MFIKSSYGVTSKTYSFWRPPAGHEDIYIEPGTLPGTYGSPVHPPSGMANLAAAQANALFMHSSPTRPGFSSSLSSSSFTLDNSDSHSTHVVATAAATATATGTTSSNGAAPRIQDLSLNHVELEAQAAEQKPLDDQEEQGEDEDPEGNVDNSCDWEKANPA